MSTGSGPAAATAAGGGRLEGLLPGDPAWLGSWQLRGRLGSGGMGTAYLGVNADGRVAAVKQLRAELVQDPTSRARFRREVALARRVDAACVAAVLDADVDGNPPFIAFAYVDGPSLIEQVRARGPLPPDQLLALALGLGDALRAIHEAGVVHRDLSGNNVLITDAGPKVIDFGIARSVEADATAVTSTQVGIGTPGWMAPEQIRGQPPTPAADVFSWGCLVAYAAGCPPFGQDRSDAVLYRTVHEPPQLPDLPSPLDTLVPAAVEKDPQRRPTAAALTAGLQGDGRAEPVAAAVVRTWRVEPVTTSELSTLHTATAPRRRRLRPAHLVLGVIGALASIAAGAGVAIFALDAVEPGAGDDSAAVETALADDESAGEDQREPDAAWNEGPPATEAPSEPGDGDDSSQDALEGAEALQRGEPDGLPSGLSLESGGLPMPAPSEYIGANPRYDLAGNTGLIRVTADVDSDELAEWWLAQSSDETWEWTITEDAPRHGDRAHPDAERTLSALAGTGGEGSSSALIEITTPDTQGIVVTLYFAG